MRCASDLGEIRRTIREVESALGARGLAGALISDLNLALTEAMTNIARHGYRGEGGEIRLSIAIEPDHLRCELEDGGVAFNPDLLGHRSPDPAELREGGYGWYILRRLSDRLCYTRDNGHNRLCFWMPIVTMNGE